MPDWSKKFKTEYDYARAWLGHEANFSEQWRPLVKKLYKMMSDSGFDAGEAKSLSELRKMVTRGESKMIGHKKVTEDQGILEAVGAWTSDAGGTVEIKNRMRAAALKLLRHVYLLNKSGNRKVWIVSLPKTFQAWPSRDMAARATTQISARVLLRSSDEIFSANQKKLLAVSTQQSIAWCQKACMVLASASKATGGKAGAKGVDALNIVKRWFADPSTSVTELDSYIATLTLGFKNIIARLNKGHLVLTDWVPLRNASTADELSFLNAEAFTFGSSGEGLDVVYIERSFFIDHPGNVLKGQKNWTRIVVHELTHLVCGTEDVNIGNARYAWYGIGPHAGYPGARAANNADNWAFFCADCAGVLTAGERKIALKII